MDKTLNFVPPCGAEQFAVYANWTKFLVLSGFSPLAIRERRRRTDCRRPVNAEAHGRAAARAQHRRAACFGTAGAETSAAARHSKNGEKAAETRGRPPAISKRGGRSIKKTSASLCQGRRNAVEFTLYSAAATNKIGFALRGRLSAVAALSTSPGRRAA